MGKSKKKSKSQSKYKCGLCDNRDVDKPIVACDKCEKWYHFSCVNIVSIGKKDTWICPKCEPIRVNADTFSCVFCRHADNKEMVECSDCLKKFHFVCLEMDLANVPKPFMCAECYSAKWNTNKASSLQQRNTDASVHSIRSCGSSKYSIYSSRQMMQMELEFLEEQRLLHERWDRRKEILEQEYLLEKYKILKDTGESNAASVIRKERVQSFVDDQIKNQHRSNTEDVVKTKQQMNSIDMNDFLKRLERLKYGEASSLERSYNYKATFNRQNQRNADSKPLDPFQRDEKNFDFGERSHKSQHRFDLHADNDRTPPDESLFHNPNHDASYNFTTGPQNNLFNKKATSQPEQTLSKNQIAARHVVKSTLQHFYGDPLEWTSWFSSYENSTNLCGYSDAENLLRLKDCLKGRAKEAVKHRLLSPSEVPNIINTLRMLYGRPELILNVLLKNVKEIQPPKADKLETLVDYAMEVNSINATIESAQLHYHLSNPTLIQELVEKLPTHTKIDWAKYKATQSHITLKKLAEWLYNLAEIVCTVTVPNTSRPDEKKTKRGTERVNVHQIEQVVKKSSKASTSSDNTSSGNVRQCKICDRKCPDPSECSTYKSFDVKQRWEAVTSKKLCRKCLRSHNGFCRLTKECGINGCTFKHHPTLHNEQKSDSSKLKPESTLNETSATVSNNFHNVSIPDVLFRIIPVALFNKDEKVETFAYIDEGSTGTLIEEALTNELKAIGCPERLCLQWTNNVHRIEENSSRIDIAISGRQNFNVRYKIKGVRTVKDLGLPTQTINQQELVKKFPYLKGIPLIEYTNERPRILIGLPHARLCTQLVSIEGSEYQPIASKSRIGWSLHGPTREQQNTFVQSMNQHRVTVCEKRWYEGDEELHRLVKDHFTLENFGVNINTEFNLNSKENQRALKLLQDNSKRINGRFETSLLWRYDNFELEDSFEMAKRRLICLEKSQRKYIPTIDATIDDYIAKGYVTKLTPADLSIKRSRVGYLPIFIVVHPKKPEKFRMVFDAAAKTNGTSLNDMLLKGPDQLNSLIDILRRFREHVIVICADIFEMYHQIQINDEDKHVQRFLWRNGNSQKHPDTYVLNVMTFGAKCSPSSAQFIKNLNAEEFRDEAPKAVNAIVSNTYVDDMMDGGESEDQVIQLVMDVQRIHEHGGFKIGKFLSNSPKVLEALGEKKQVDTKQIALDPTQNVERVLGMFWNTSTDCFKFSLKYAKINESVVSGDRFPTKREVLQTLMSIFDPLGLLQYYLVRLKILLQKVWRSKLQWDEQLTNEEHRDYWTSWFKLLPQVERMEIPRLYSSNLTSSSVELHCFVDASEDAYAAVAFLRIQSGAGVKCILIGSKTRVAPIKYVSIPRLELQAAVLGTRHMMSIENSQNVKFNRRFFWTDSHTVISWIRSDHKKYQQFVAHRIGEILANSDQEMWRWLPGKENVADDATKWIKPPSFDTNSRWFKGPAFLYQSEENWPTEVTTIEPDTPEEMKIHCMYARFVQPSIIVPERFSNWNRMVRALAYVFHYVKILRAKIRNEEFPSYILSQDELNKSKNLILRQAQNEGYPNEMTILKRNQEVHATKRLTIPKTSSLISCSPYLDDNGLLRMRGRIDAASVISFDQKRPIIMPKNNTITNLLVDSYHRMFLHRNYETVINEIKQRYYIPQLRVILKMVRRRCQYCKNLFIRPKIPEMGNLPYARLAVGFNVFTYTGIDYFGPIKIVDGRISKKRWGVLFTCLTTRAIHLEIAHSMNTESCIMCIRNFIVHHGPPREIYTDNGTNFEGADNELSKEVAKLDEKQLASTFTTCYTEWKFNPPIAPHQGGVWERLVRSVKTSLYDILPDRLPTDEQLKNLLAEIQFIVNSRPLTFVPLEHESDEALTPNHFIFGSSNGTKPILLPEDRPNLRSKWRENQRLADLFWKRFIKEYLPTVTRRTKWFDQVEPLKVGDVVLIMDTEGPRNSYPKAVVIEVFPGSNKQVRRARVQKSDKSILTRPATKLAKLDISPPQESLAVSQGNNQTGGSVTDGGFGS